MLADAKAAGRVVQMNDIDSSVIGPNQPSVYASLNRLIS
jgi:hypothetical protein